MFRYIQQKKINNVWHISSDLVTKLTLCCGIHFIFYFFVSSRQISIVIQYIIHFCDFFLSLTLINST